MQALTVEWEMLQGKRVCTLYRGATQIYRLVWFRELGSDFNTLQIQAQFKEHLGKYLGRGEITRYEYDTISNATHYANLTIHPKEV
jgi:hypothetical protein